MRSIDRLAADFQHDGHREGGNALEMLVDDGAMHAGKHLRQPVQIEQAGHGVVPRGAQQNVIGLMAAQHIIDEIR